MIGLMFADMSAREQTISLEPPSEHPCLACVNLCVWHDMLYKHQAGVMLILARTTPPSTRGANSSRGGRVRPL